MLQQNAGKGKDKLESCLFSNDPGIGVPPSVFII